GIEALEGEMPVEDAQRTIRLIPKVNRLELLGGNLANLIARAEQIVSDATDVGRRLSKLPAVGVGNTSGLLHKRLEGEIARAATLVSEAKERLTSAVAA